jgi:hypothetical protein
MFAKRCGHEEGLRHWHTDISPVFLQFLEVIAMLYSDFVNLSTFCLVCFKFNKTTTIIFRSTSMIYYSK